MTKTRTISSAVDSFSNPAIPSLQYRNKETKQFNPLINDRREHKGKRKASYKLHSLIALLPLPKSYPGKMILITFFIAYLPMLASISYLLTSHPINLLPKLQILSISLFSTILGIVFTAYSLKLLLSSLSLVSHTLSSNINSKDTPTLSYTYVDELERLMSDIHFSIDDLQRHIRSLEETSMTDYLTGVYNRHSGEKRLREDISRAQRSGAAISLIMLDIDDFKTINDRYGHYVGDICLKHLVKIMQSKIRMGDWLMRWGGDEFILILFNSDQKTSEKIIERIFLAIREQPALTQKGEISLSLSAGICQHNGKDDAQEIFKKADSALLSAKRWGKSQIVYYPDTIPISDRGFLSCKSSY